MCMKSSAIAFWFCPDFILNLLGGIAACSTLINFFFMTQKTLPTMTSVGLNLATPSLVCRDSYGGRHLPDQCPLIFSGCKSHQSLLHVCGTGFLFLVLSVSQILARSTPKPLSASCRPDSHTDLWFGHLHANMTNCVNVFAKVFFSIIQGEQYQQNSG